MRRTLWSLAALVMLALIVAGCANASAGTASGGTAPAGSGSSGGNNTAATPAEPVKFAECMRANGVSEFPDPNASGQFVYGIKKGSSLDPSSAAWQTAISACKDLEPPNLLSSKASPQETTARLKFAQCMRDNGVKDFPDPTESGPLINVKDARSIPGFQAAAQKCLKVYTGAGGGQ